MSAAEPSEVLSVGRRAWSRAPATSANLGPGFDALGLAWDWYDTTEIEVIEQGSVLDIGGEGRDQVPRDERHLVLRTVRHGLDLLGARAPGLLLRAVNTIPHSRGLGSSAAAIVAGLGLAWALARPGRPLDRAWVLDQGHRIEGHPDNIAAATYGGFTIAWLEEGVEQLTAQVARGRLAPGLGGVVYLPQQQLPTSHARGVLPDVVPLAEAAANSARAALLSHALAHEPARLLPATRDWLHQDARAGQYPESIALVRRLRATGVAAVISGAGPTVVALADDGGPAVEPSPGFRGIRHRPGRGLTVGQGAPPDDLADHPPTTPPTA